MAGPPITRVPHSEGNGHQSGLSLATAAGGVVGTRLLIDAGRQGDCSDHVLLGVLSWSGRGRRGVGCGVSIVRTPRARTHRALAGNPKARSQLNVARSLHSRNHRGGLKPERYLWKGFLVVDSISARAVGSSSSGQCPVSFMTPAGPHDRRVGTGRSTFRVERRKQYRCQPHRDRPLARAGRRLRRMCDTGRGSGSVVAAGPGAATTRAGTAHRRDRRVVRRPAPTVRMPACTCRLSAPPDRNQRGT